VAKLQRFTVRMLRSSYSAEISFQE